MAINERLIHTAAAAAGGGTGNQEEGLVLYLDANDVDSYDGDGSVWYDITNHEYTPTTNVSEHFNTVTYTGNGGNDNPITGVGFQPDLVWIKGVNIASHHVWMDSVRGASSIIGSSFTNAASSQNASWRASFGELDSFDSDGFTVSDGTNATSNFNSAHNYVAWCFKAGGPTDGTNIISIDDTQYTSYTDAGLTQHSTAPSQELSVNTKLGISIVKANSVSVNHNNKKLTHGLGQEPEMSIYKFTNVSSSWYVYHKDLGKDRYLVLNATDAQSSAYANRFFMDANHQNALLDSSSRDFVIYNFISKRGVSKVGSYTGTGAAGNKVYTGFEPAFIMVKRSSSAGAGWYIVDNKRDTNTNKNKYISANSNAAEATSGASVTFNTDGFTFNGSSFNTSGATHIYLAFAAEKPSSLIDDTNLELDFDPKSITSDSFTAWVDSESSVSLTKSGTVERDQELGNFVSFGGAASDTFNGAISSTIKDSNNDYTIEYWWYYDSISSQSSFVAGKQSSIYGNYIYSTSSTLYFDEYKSGTYSSAQQLSESFSNLGITTGKWYHHTWVIDASTNIKLYIDGELKKTSTTGAGGTRWSALTNLEIGGSQGSYTGQGDCGGVKFYKQPLTADEVMQNYRFTKNDYPNGLNAELQNGASWNSGGYMVLDGVNDKISIPDNDLLSINDGSRLSFSFWFKDTENSSSYRVIFSKGGSNKYEYAFFFYATGSSRGFLFTTYYNGGTNADARNLSSSNTWIGTNTWHHIAITIDEPSTTVKVYVDGTERGSDTSWNYGNYQNNDPFIFGGRADLTSNFFEGHINNFKLFDKVLTQSEITALNDAGYQG